MQIFVLTMLIMGLVGGQLTSLPFVAGIRVTLLDAAVMLMLFYAAGQKSKKPIRLASFGKTQDRQGRRFIPPLWAPILGFGAVTIISLALTLGIVPTYVIGGGLLYVLRWLTYAALYWVAAGPLIAPGTWFVVLISSGIGIAGMGLVQYIWYPDLRNLYYLGWDPHYQRLFSTLLDPNFTGIILGVTALMLLTAAEARNYTAGKMIGLVMTIGALILTYSRSSLVAFGVGLLVFGILTKRKVFMVGITATIIAALLILPHTGEGRNLFRTVSSYARLGNAARAMVLIREKPVFGHGFNLLRFVATERSWIDEAVIPSRSGSGLDTSMLFVGATTGAIGMLVYGWLIVRLFRLGISGLRGKDKVRIAAAGYISVLAALMTHSLFINSLFYPWVMAWIWLSTGAMERHLTADR